MARQEIKKEDLLREATALVERIELAPHNASPHEHVTAGFRRDGALSIFFGGDPAYHFNAAGELRRAYCDGLLFKAERGRLVSLRRMRQQGEVQLLRHELTDAEQSAFLSQMQNSLASLVAVLTSATFYIIGQTPPDSDIAASLHDWFGLHDGSKIASSPYAERP